MRHSLRHRRRRIRMHASACVARRGRSRALAAATPERPARHSRCNLSGSVATRHVRCDAVGCVWRVAGGTSSAASTPNPASKRRSSRRSTWRVRRAFQSGNFRSVSALSIANRRRSDAPIGACCCNSVQRVAIGRAAASVLQRGLLGGFLPRRRRARTLRRPPARKRVALRGARHETGVPEQVPMLCAAIAGHAQFCFFLARRGANAETTVRHTDWRGVSKLVTAAAY